MVDAAPHRLTVSTTTQTRTPMFAKVLLSHARATVYFDSDGQNCVTFVGMKPPLQRVRGGGARATVLTRKPPSNVALSS